LCAPHQSVGRAERRGEERRGEESVPIRNDFRIYEEESSAAAQR